MHQLVQNVVRIGSTIEIGLYIWQTFEGPLEWYSEIHVYVSEILN